ncbi:MAG TPA: hypothetical protein VK137_20985, partial [Planctomycetaceae bacterium]|nr:hypothetical protein [Planctomycetaceae bacterium]
MTTRLALIRILVVGGLWLSVVSAAWAQTSTPLGGYESAPLTTELVRPASPHKPERLEQARTPFAVDRSPLQIVIPERVLNLWLTKERVDAGPVRDVIMNAEVVGRQTTTTRVRADCRPNDEHAEIHLVLRGTVQSDTVGMTRQAAVSTVGRHGVVAVKPVMFDGRQFSTRRPRVWVDVHNQHVAARTPLDGVPFLDGIARGTALSIAERLRPQGDAATAEHLGAQLGPQFNRDADRQLGRLNRLLKTELQTRYGDFWPNRLSPRTTDSHLLLFAAWADAPEVAVADTGRETDTPVLQSGLGPVAADDDADAVTVRLHESVLNACLQRLPLAGQTYSEPQLREAFESLVTKFGGRAVASNKIKKVSLPGMTPLIRFADKDPVRVKIADGQLLLIVNVGVEVAGQTVLAQDEITLPLSWTVRSDECQIVPGRLAFAKGDNGVSLVSMMESLARSQLAEAIPATLLPQSIAIPVEESPPLSLRLAKVDASSGWLTVSLHIESSMESRQKPVSEEIFPSPPPAPMPSQAEAPTVRRFKPTPS